jgi:hypothetical protein
MIPEPTTTHTSIAVPKNSAVAFVTDRFTVGLFREISLQLLYAHRALFRAFNAAEERPPKGDWEPRPSVVL